MGFATFPASRHPTTFMVWQPVAFPATLHPSKNSPHPQPYRVTAADCPPEVPLGSRQFPFPVPASSNARAASNLAYLLQRSSGHPQSRSDRGDPHVVVRRSASTSSSPSQSCEKRVAFRVRNSLLSRPAAPPGAPATMPSAAVSVCKHPDRLHQCTIRPHPLYRPGSKLPIL